MLSISLQNQKFSLHPSGAMYWHDEDMLLIADVHFGKVAHFRKYGAAVPPAASRSNFNKLQQVTSVFEPNTICFLGDLFHSSMNNAFLQFKEWALRCPSNLILIAGNHDIISPLQFEALGMKVLDRLTLGPFILTHHPTDSDTHFNLSGHLHPGVRLQGVGRQVTKLPCFYKRPHQLVLPAFGSFTGKYIVTPTKDDEIYVLAEDEVISVTH